MKPIYIILMPLFLLTACNPYRSDMKEPELANSSPKTSSMPVIPATIKNERDREIYLAQHYWDDVDFNVIDNYFSKDEMKQKFVDYLGLLSVIPEDHVRANIPLFLNRIVQYPVVFRHFINLFDNFLNDPRSPLKNEEWYIIVLEYVIHSPKVEELNKIKLQYQLKMLCKNRKGNAATDFAFINPSGEHGNLYTLESPYTLVIFYDPDCEYCQATINELRNNPLLQGLQRDKRLKVLAVYTENESKLWLDYAPKMPVQWINVTDEHQITLHKKYDLRALPSLYLLDGDKKVLLKDTSVEDLQDYLYDHIK